MNKVIGYYPLTLEVNIVIYGIDDKIRFSWNIYGKVKKTRYSKVRYEKERAYFNTCNHKIYLDECMRVEE